MSLNFSKRALLASSILLGSAIPSMALDADAFAQQLVKTFAKSGSVMEVGSASLDGNNVTLSSVKFKAPEQDFPVGDILFTGVTETGDGGYEAETATMDDIDATTRELRFQLSGIEITNIKIPAGEEMASVSDMFLYERFKTGPLIATVKNVDVFKFSGSDFTVDIADQSEMGFTGSVDGIAIDLSLVDDRRARQTIESMGYNVLTGDMKMAGAWEVEAGRINMPEMALTLNDVGRLNTSLDISGYTMEFLQELQTLQSEMIGKENDPKAQQAMGLATMGLMQQLTFNSLAFRFDDASLTGKVLEFAGKQQGISGEQMAQAAKGLLPFVLGRLGIPALQQQISEAANTYLDDPKNIEIKAAPEAPVPFGQIAGSAMGDPRSLADLLNVQVTANQ